MNECSTCHGSGKAIIVCGTRDGSDPFPNRLDCFRCNGTGQDPEPPVNEFNSDSLTIFDEPNLENLFYVITKNAREGKLFVYDLPSTLRMKN